MTKLKVLAIPNPVLKKVSDPIEKVDNEIRKIMNNMLETMYQDNGIGLAANQVGILKRIIVIDLQDQDDDARREGSLYPLYIANPEIIESSSDIVEAEEGCLSVPDQRITVPRHASILIRYIDYHNQTKELFASDWLARVIQHEMDHLNGKLLIDYLSPLKKNILLRKITKFQKLREI